MTLVELRDRLLENAKCIQRTIDLLGPTMTPDSALRGALVAYAYAYSIAASLVEQVDGFEKEGGK